MVQEYLFYYVLISLPLNWGAKPKWCRNIHKAPEKVLQSSFCDPLVYKVFDRAVGLKKVFYVNKEYENFRNPIQVCIWGRGSFAVVSVVETQHDRF